MEKIWIVGASGQLGRAFKLHMDPLDAEILITDEEVDVTDLKEIDSFGNMSRPDVIINCAAITDVDVCDKNPDLAYKVNAIGARNLAIVAESIGAKLVQISTDDVFSGLNKLPYTEYDETHPRTVYGQSKLAGEEYVKNFCSKHFIVRSNWVYGKGESNFLYKVLKAAKNEKTFRVSPYQMGSPTSSFELAKFIIQLIDTDEFGLYHATCSGSCSRYEFAKEIVDFLGLDLSLEKIELDEDEILDANVSDRPWYAVLDNFVMRITDLYQMPEWKVALHEYLEKLQ
ncbi:MAG: dTDP-4-dehydrorhamnose reductase [Lachnospiraceae bacterium]|jgi:dTDP-4-dehydrorhamnose reductase|nr:dTDP-4-dehydrorhamnose reductase [Lachnospiraceae bacterium]